ncbi:TPA: fimbrial protein [Pseudomonas aeruginosa]
MRKVTVLLAVSLVSGGVLAAPTVTFQGEVTAQTCQASINGETNSIVLLPAVSASSLSTAGATAGLTSFTISVSGCSQSTTAMNISTNFLGHNVTSAGNLGNSATGSSAANNVQLQLTTDGAGTTPIVLNGVTSVAGLSLPANQTSASYEFGVRYISEAGGATAGTVTAVAEYTISYL